MIMMKVKASCMRNSSHIYLVICLFIHYSLQETTSDTNDVTDKGHNSHATNKKDKEMDKIDKSKINSDVIKPTFKTQVRQSKSTVANIQRTSQLSKHYDSRSHPTSLSVIRSILNQINGESTARPIDSRPFSFSSTVRLGQVTASLLENSKTSSRMKSSQRPLLKSNTANSKITTSTILIKPTPSVVLNSNHVMTSTTTLKQSPKPTSTSSKDLLQTSKIEPSLTKSSVQESSVQSTLQISMKNSKPILLKVSSSIGSLSSTSRKILISETVSDNFIEPTAKLDRSGSTSKTKRLSSFTTSFVPVEFSQIFVSGIEKTSSSTDEKGFEMTKATMMENNLLRSSLSPPAPSLLPSLTSSKIQTTSSSQTDNAVMTHRLSSTPPLSSATRSIIFNTEKQTVTKDVFPPASSKPIEASPTFSEISKSVESKHSVLKHSQEGAIYPSEALSTVNFATPVQHHESTTLPPSRSVAVLNLSMMLPFSIYTTSSSVGHMTQRQSTVTILQLHPSASNTPITFDPSSFADAHKTAIPTSDAKTANHEQTTLTQFTDMISMIATEVLSASQSTKSQSSSFLSQHQSITPSNSFIKVSTNSRRKVNSTAVTSASKAKIVGTSTILRSEAVTQTASHEATEQRMSSSKIAKTGTPSITAIRPSTTGTNRSTSVTNTVTPSQNYTVSKMDAQMTSEHQSVSNTTSTTSSILERSSYLVKDDVSVTVTSSRSSFFSSEIPTTFTPVLHRSSRSMISSKSLVVSSTLSTTVMPSSKRLSSYFASPSMSLATFSPILSTKFIIKPVTTTTSMLTPKSELITASKTLFATVSRNHSSVMKLSISPSGNRSTTPTVKEVYPSSVTRASSITTIHATSQTIIHSQSRPSSKWPTNFIPSLTTLTTTATTAKDKVTIAKTTLHPKTVLTLKTTIRTSTTTSTTTMKSRMSIVPTTLRATTATTMKTTIRTTTTATKPTTIPVGPTSKEPVTEKPTTERSPTTQHERTTQPPVITDPEVLTKNLASYPTSINIHFRVIFPGIEEADRLRIVAQRFDHRVSGNGKILRRWFEVHYFEDYKYEPYVAGEVTRKHLVQRKSFNFTIGNDVRCEKAQVRFAHCNGPLHAGSYRVRLMYRVHGIERKGTFSKVYTTSTTKPTAKDENTGISQNSITIAVIAVLAVLLVIIVIVAIILYRRKNSQANDHRDTEVSDCTLLTSLKRSSSCSKSCYGRGAMTPGDSSLMLKSLTKGMSRPVHVKDFIAWVNRSQADSDFRFAEEFESIRDVGRDQSHEASDLPENRGKNRYVNVLAYDRTRVKLSYTDDEIGSDYINANYIHGYKHPRAYIAAQGPLPGTTDDFWRMIWEQNTFNIVMVTQCVERSRVKCHEYWPGTQPTAYGDIIVSLLSEFAFPEWVEREFLLEVEGDGTRRIHHYQYTAWPDHGVPKNAISCMEFIHNVRSYVLPGQGPVVIHCSAGVGRTGTLISIDTIFDRLQDEDTIDVYLCLCMMRMQRCCMVQTEDQYIFIHRVLVEYLKSRELISPLKGYCLLPKEENAEDPITPPAIDAPVTNRDSGLALLLGEYDTERADEALESVA